MEKQRKTFLSYSRVNKDFAVRLAKELKSEGFNVWLDLLDIPAGARWDIEVENALEECEIFMIIMTPAAIGSENVRDEIGYAIDNSKRFLPVLLEQCNVPLRLRRFQYVDFTNKSFDDGVESAKELLRNLIEQTTIPRGAAVGGAQAQAEAERKSKEEAERIAKRVAEERAAAKAEADRKAKEEAERIAKQKAEAELAAKAKADREAKAEADRKAKQEAERLATQKAEAERSARQQAEDARIAREQQELEKKRLQAEAQSPKPAPVAPASEARSVPPGKKSRFPLGIAIGVGVVILVAIGGILMMGGGGNSAQNPDAGSAAETLPTSTSRPTATVKPTVQATRTAAAEIAQPTERPTQTRVSVPTETALPAFFTMEFTDNTDLSNFEYSEIGSGDESNLEITQSPDGLVFLLNDRDLYVYYMYLPYYYEDAVIRVRAENTGTINNNNVSLVCRKSDNTWYEFSVTSGGLWDLWTHDDSGYTSIGSGGVASLKTGQQVNDYEMRCIGDALALYVNGKEVTTLTNDAYTEGLVGFNISSLNVYPIELLVSEFEISEP